MSTGIVLTIRHPSSSIVDGSKKSGIAFAALSFLCIGTFFFYQSFFFSIKFLLSIREKHLCDVELSGVLLVVQVVRYHSLIIDATTLPECLVPTAWTVADGEVVGFEGWQDGFSSANSGLSSEGSLWQGGDNIGHPEGTRDTYSDGKRATKLLMGVSHRNWPHHGVQVCCCVTQIGI